MIAKQTGNL